MCASTACRHFRDATWAIVQDHHPNLVTTQAKSQCKRRGPFARRLVSGCTAQWGMQRKEGECKPSDTGHFAVYQRSRPTTRTTMCHRGGPPPAARSASAKRRPTLTQRQTEVPSFQICSTSKSKSDGKACVNKSNNSVGTSSVGSSSPMASVGATRSAEDRFGPTRNFRFATSDQSGCKSAGEVGQQSVGVAGRGGQSWNGNGGTKPYSSLLRRTKATHDGKGRCLLVVVLVFLLLPCRSYSSTSRLLVLVICNTVSSSSP